MKRLTEYIAESLVTDSEYVRTEPVTEGLFKKLFGWLKKIFLWDLDDPKYKDQDKTKALEKIKKLSPEERRKAEKEFGKDFDKKLDPNDREVREIQFKDDRRKLKQYIERISGPVLERLTFMTFEIKPDQILRRVLKQIYRNKPMLQYVVTDRTTLTELMSSIAVTDNGLVQYINGDKSHKFKCLFYYTVDQEYMTVNHNTHPYPLIHFYNVDFRINDPKDAQELLKFMENGSYRNNVRINYIDHEVRAAIENLAKK